MAGCKCFLLEDKQIYFYVSVYCPVCEHHELRQLLQDFGTEFGFSIQNFFTSHNSSQEYIGSLILWQNNNWMFWKQKDQYYSEISLKALDMKYLFGTWKTNVVEKYFLLCVYV